LTQLLDKMLILYIPPVQIFLMDRQKSLAFQDQVGIRTFQPQLFEIQALQIVLLERCAWRLFLPTGARCL
jgi:hypothetical protein